MKFSLGTKIFLSFSTVLFLFGITSIFTITRMENVWESFWFIRESIEPCVDELKKMGRELRGYEDSLESERPSDMVWIREFLPSFKPFNRILELSVILKHTSSSKYVDENEKKIFLSLGERLIKIGDRFEIYNELRGEIHNPEIEKFVKKIPSPAMNSEVYEALAREFVFYINEEKYNEALNLRDALKKVFRFIKKNVLLATREITPVVDNIYERISKNKGRVRIILSVVSAFSLILSLLVLFYTMKMLKPVKELIKGVQKVSGGDYSERVNIKSSDEIGELAKEFNNMASNLCERDSLLKKQSEELIRAERLAAIGKMASIITHEIRNPLNAIALNTEMLEEEILNLKTEGVDKLTPLTNAIGKEVERVCCVTENYLSLSRLPSPNLQKCEINELIEDILRFISIDLKTRGIEANFEYQKVSSIMVDENQMRQAILNILKNSIEALSYGGKIIVRTGKENNKVFISIKDNGGGIDDNIKEKIFDPFFTTKKGGTGLGLPIVQQIITEHKGEISVSSKKGEGTQFVIYLPLPIEEK